MPISQYITIGTKPYRSTLSLCRATTQLTSSQGDEGDDQERQQDLHDEQEGTGDDAGYEYFIPVQTFRQV